MERALTPKWTEGMERALGFLFLLLAALWICRWLDQRSTRRLGYIFPLFTFASFLPHNWAYTPLSRLRLSVVTVFSVRTKFDGTGHPGFTLSGVQDPYHPCKVVNTFMLSLHL